MLTKSGSYVQQLAATLPDHAGAQVMAEMWQVPALVGPVLLAYRIVWIAAFAAAVAGAGWLNIRTERQEIRFSQANYATGIRFVGGYAEGTHVAPFSGEAFRAGIHPNELILDVDGHKLPETQAGAATRERFRLLEGPPGSRLRLTLRRGDGSVHDVTLTRSPDYVRNVYAGTGLTLESRRWIAFAFMWAAASVSIVAAALMFLRRPRDPVTALISLSLLFFVISGLDMPNTAHVILEQAWLAALLTGILLFPSATMRRGRLAISVVVILVAATLHGASYWVPPIETLGNLLTLVAAAMTIAVVVARYRRLPPGIARQQIKFALLGFAAFAAFLVAQYLFSLVILSNFGEHVRIWSILGQSVSTAFGQMALAIGLLVSLLRYRLYDADALVSRSAAYAFITLLLGATFAGSEKVIEVLGEEFFGESMRSISAGLGAAVAAVVVTPLHGRIHRWAERRFQKGLIALRVGLPKLVGDMREYAAPPTLMGAVADRLEHGVRASSIVILTEDGDGRLAPGAIDGTSHTAYEAWREGWSPDRTRGLECDRDDPVFPARLPLVADGVGTVGWILLGPRPDGSFYGKDEREALSEIADPVARAIHIAGQREARETSLRQEVADLRKRISQIEAAPLR